MSHLLFHASAPSAFYTLSLHDALPILDDDPDRARDHHQAGQEEDRLALLVVGRAQQGVAGVERQQPQHQQGHAEQRVDQAVRSEEHTSELQSLAYLVCRLLLEKKNEILSSSARLADSDTICEPGLNIRAIRSLCLHST